MSNTANTSHTRALVSEADEKGHFGPYGGVFIAETLMEPVSELRAAYRHDQNDPEFKLPLPVYVIIKAIQFFVKTFKVVGKKEIP